MEWAFGNQPALWPPGPRWERWNLSCYFPLSFGWVLGSLKKTSNKYSNRTQSWTSSPLASPEPAFPGPAMGAEPVSPPPVCCAQGARKFPELALGGPGAPGQGVVLQGPPAVPPAGRRPLGHVLFS